MNFIFRILLIGITSYYIVEPIPWWSIILIPFILGLIFEDKIYNQLVDKYNTNIVKICESYQSRDIKYYNKTIEKKENHHKPNKTLC